jgi:stearoyl-CoA desaturase (Delta-9 desaturase)
VGPGPRLANALPVLDSRKGARVPVEAVQTNTIQADTIQAGTVLADTLRGDDLRANAELAGNMAGGKVPAKATIGGGTTPSAIAAVTARSITILLLAGPVVAVAVSVPLLWGRAVNLTDLILAVVLYAITGHGLTVGFHRLFTHRSFEANRGLKIGLAVAGSMGIEGSVVSWVANHRRHHAHSDKVGDPHSPHILDESAVGQLRGFIHAHVGWLLSPDMTSVERYAPDILRDPDLVAVGRMFPLLAIVSLAVPFGIGWAISGTLVGAISAFVWAGLVRMALLHHVTWGVNSICHMVGRRPFTTTDESRNVAALAVLSMGESWHNLHHAYPTSARHGVLRGQVDSSARIIWLMEKFGWATKVRWPAAAKVSALTVPATPTSVAA